ncbi:MAG: SIMPL domain-containing protein [Halobacteriales archaeon]
MVTKKRVIAVFLLGALVAGGALLATGVSAQGQNADDGASEEFVRVSANGAVDAEADATEIRLAVEARDDDPSEARERVAENASGMRDALEDVGVSDDEIESTDYVLREAREYERREGSTDTPRHYARHEYLITVDGTDSAGEIIDAAVEGGATTVGDVSFTLSDDRRTELRNDALREAMENARSQADAVAGAGDISVAGVRSVSTTDTDVSPVSYDRAALEAEEDSGDTSVDPGPVEIDATVEVVYDTS